MKIILQKEIDKLGAPGDVVEVADGYARNYLVPRGMAIPASKGAVRHADSLRRAHQGRVAKAQKEAEAVAARITAGPLKVRAKAGEGGKLFGSVTAADLAEEIEQQTGEKIDRRMVHLEEPIRSVGVHEVRIHLHPEVDAALSVEIHTE
ncbi:MAG: 50S ribosomal protein L9 [Actinomycetota bacterium]|nr:50S ribosomal protein L9 [Actinomycetota bacterium]